MASAHPTPSNNAGAQGALAAANEEFWSNSAETIFNEQWVLDFQVKLQAFLEKNMDWLGIVNDRTSAAEAAEKKMLDYACGDGFLTRVYHPYFTKCIGIDIAAGMVKKYNESAIKLGLDQEKMYAVKGDLSASAPEVPKAEDVPATDISRDEFFDFDFAGVALALHHMEDPEAAIARMVDRLKSGGVLLAIDLLKTESKDGEGNGGNHHHHHHHHQGGHGHGHGHSHGHGEVKSPGHDHVDVAAATGHTGAAGHTISHDHPTFSAELVKSMFARAGLVDVDIMFSDWKLELPFVTDPDAKLLFAKGRKP